MAIESLALGDRNVGRGFGDDAGEGECIRG
jgi:hypothetical protein